VASRLSFDLPVPLSRAVAFADGQSIVVAGGLSSTGSLRSILSIDPTTGHLVQAGQLAAAVHDAASAVAGGRLLVFGGGNLVPVRTVQQIAGPRATVVGQLPRVRADLAAVTVGERSIVLGGGTPAELDRAILATADGATFRTIGSLRLGARYPAVAAVSGRILVLGGTDGAHDLDDIQAVDPVSGSVRLIGRLPHGLSHAAAFVLGGRVLVAGGRTAGQAQDSIWAVDPITGSVTLAGHLPVAISDFAAVVLNGVGYLLGGETDAFQASIVVIRLV
jgi:N-acetylneuraminic acid mutarotase